jgi:hypothetical protein
VDSARPHESQLAEPTLATIRVPRPKALVADNADESRECRRDLRHRGIKPTIPTVARRIRPRPKRGRPIRTGPNDRPRWKVERCFGWMDHDRRLVVRDARSVDHDKAFCLMAIIFV